MNKYYKLLNILYYSALALSAYTLFKIYFSRKGLPPGSCPVSTFKTEIILSIFLSVTYLILSFFIKKPKE